MIGTVEKAITILENLMKDKGNVTIKMVIQIHGENVSQPSRRKQKIRNGTAVRVTDNTIKRHSKVTTYTKQPLTYNDRPSSKLENPVKATQVESISVVEDKIKTTKGK